MITSTSNQKIRRLANLKKRRKLRDEGHIFLVEGIRMFEEIPRGRLLELYVTERFYQREKRLVDEKRARSRCAFELVSDYVMEYISDTQHPQGVLCVVSQRGGRAQKKILMPEGRDKACPLLLVLDNLQDPGNLGTILRTAEAAGATGVVMGSTCVDVYNPKVIRSTMGSVFRVPFWYAEDLGEAIRQMKGLGIRTYAAHLEGSVCYDEEDYRRPAAFLIGNEGSGLGREVAALADTFIKIPMEGRVESLNAAAAAAVLLYEAGRQRRH